MKSKAIIATVLMMFATLYVQGQRPLRAVMDIPYDHNSLTAGYNYRLLCDFSASLGRDIEIFKLPEGRNALELLREREYDIVVVPHDDPDMRWAPEARLPVDSLALWCTTPWCSFRNEMADWLESLPSSRSYRLNRALFLGPRMPFRVKEPKAHLSPYDDLFRKYAGLAGWDWRLLAAVAYCESRFHIEAGSHRGAMGMMQMMPVASERFGAVNSFDPEQSIKAGARYLGSLSRMFEDLVPDPEERTKYVIASYNGGEGRILRWIEYGEELGVNTAEWKYLAEVMSVKETVGYVDEVMAVYEQYCRICP